MINKIIDEINLALDNNLYFVALATVVILPDACGKVEFPNDKSSDRYVKWYQKYIGDEEKSPYDKGDEYDFPYMSGEVMYKLRNMILHEGDPSVKKAESNIDEFILICEPKNEFSVYADYAMVSLSTPTYKRYKVSIRRLCNMVCKGVKGYYEKNKERFAFTCKIIDVV